MSSYDAIALFAIMMALAAMPSSSVALVIARTTMLNVKNGFAASIGIVAGDLIFVFIAILGLTALSEQLGAFFVIVRYIAATYLIWFGVTIIRSRCTKRSTDKIITNGGLVTSFLSGLFLTLGDIKAILFYASLFPAFTDISALGQADITLITAITVIAVGGVKMGYAVTAHKIIAASKEFAFDKEAKITAGSLMIGVGGYMIIKT